MKGATSVLLGVKGLTLPWPARHSFWRLDANERTYERLNVRTSLLVRASLLYVKKRRQAHVHTHTYPHENNYTRQTKFVCACEGSFAYTRSRLFTSTRESWQWLQPSFVTPGNWNYDHRRNLAHSYATFKIWCLKDKITVCTVKEYTGGPLNNDSS